MYMYTSESPIGTMTLRFFLSFCLQPVFLLNLYIHIPMLSTRTRVSIVVASRVFIEN